MAIEFNDKTIKSLKTDSNRQDFRIDTGSEKGLVISVYPNGSKRWRYIYKIEGAKRVLTLGEYPAMGLAKAKQEFLNYRNQVKLEGRDPAKEIQNEIEQTKNAVQIAMEEENRLPTVERLASEYIKRWAMPRKRSWKEDQRILDKDVLPVWGKRKAQDITRRDVITLLDGIVDRGAPIAANRTQALLSKMFRFGVGRDIVPYSPCLEITKSAPEHKKDRVLSDDEIKTHWHGILASDMTKQTKVALLLQLVTAQRKGEVVAMRWDEIDGDYWTIPAENAKNKEAHRVPLSPQAVALLDMVKNDSPWVFPADNSGHLRGDSISRATRRHLMRIKKPTASDPDAKLTKNDPEWFTPHDFRRTAATNMTKAGYNRLTVSKVLNHVEGGVTAIYDRHSYDKEKQQALEAWGRKLDAIINDADASTVIPMNRSKA
ncbi:tyrosine-type recombinase/integrase [Mariprofundus ferrooxydans]|uniref:tyrosine-type recombinase/integrase n=1 Tax=Mariprofundus ferrooxydans TaxID=314344 RepID=UPI001431491A|nr:site-specific integrase [Mariprofundus ferrooxydans]